MPTTLGELAKHCGGTLLGGDPSRQVAAAASLKDAGPADVAPLTDARYAPLLDGTRAAGVFVAEGADRPTPPDGTALIVCADPEAAFLAALTHLHPDTPETAGIDPRACVEDGATLGKDVHVGPFAVVRASATVGDGTVVMGGAYVGREVTVGRQCILHPQVVLYDRTVVGDHVIIHAGTIIGADGFGYKFRGGRHVKIPQVGFVRIGDHVEIGASTTIDCAALGETVIGEGSKLDNQVQIGHGVKLGKHVIVCGQAGIAGSVTVQDYTVMGAQAGIADHLTLGMASKVAAQSGVSKDLPPQSEVFGSPAMPRRDAWRMLAAQRKLPELIERLRALEKRVRELEGDAG